VIADRREIASIVARESAETIVGATAGLRVTAARRLLSPAAHLVARRFVEYDRMLGERGPLAGASWVSQRATAGVVVHGGDRVPRTGPLLVVANHPGLADAVALLMALGRDDAWIVAADFPFLRAMRGANQRFLFVHEGCAARISALRHIVTRLRRGDAVLLFPAGGLEPDPAMSPVAAMDTLDTWSRSIESITRLAAGTLVLPALVSGVVSRAAFDHPLARRRAPQRERQRFASMLQLALPLLQRVTVGVRFGTPLSSGAGLHDATLASMRALMSQA
jgi:acyltransferase-like protein